MREADEIMLAATRNSVVPEGYNLVESEGFYAMRQIYLMYGRGEISKEVASRNKERIYGEYRKEARDFEMVYSLYNDYASRTIRETENNRNRLRELLRDKDKIGDSDLGEALRVSLDIIESVFPGEITGMNSKIEGFPEGGF